ncbi:hypothetical protein HBH98_248290 [Parastagonospora nodorum]|nr:hypothetical protein HBH53_261410 [Parastagonospora nodorum]KAH3956108.1 hypothetical protein HBH51_254720 [Parastagonospora nodorum]KAH4215358.1 hypothetical protein HBI06_255220 [Parastagonospora nodorum]KAH4223031.1 hypothetical protein HBI05_252420 [Parastagonospora nodorum]KAH4333505.1 hypothetical protein HBH98_248290 [Parastagonospora nodorum]
MRLKDLLAVTTVITLVQARCYGTTTSMYGQSMTGAGIAINDFCAHDLAGYFSESQTKYRCLQLSKNKVEFWVAWKGRGGWTLNSEDCMLHLTNEINGCTLGGENVEADWAFRSVDPNWGPC